MTAFTKYLALSLIFFGVASQSQLFAQQMKSWTARHEGEVPSEELIKGLIGVTLAVTPVKNGEQGSFLSCKVTISNLTGHLIVFQTPRPKEPVSVVTIQKSIITGNPPEIIGLDATPWEANRIYTNDKSEFSDIKLEAKASKVYEFVLSGYADKPKSFSQGNMKYMPRYPSSSIPLLLNP